MSISIRRDGECVQCGLCCKTPILTKKIMLDEKKKDECKYLAKDGPLFICLITAGKFDTSTEKAPEIPQKEYDYWLKVCKPFPDPEQESGWNLPAECGYTMVKQ